MEIDDQDLAAFNRLVQGGLIEVATIEDGIPYYRIASEFGGPPAPPTDSEGSSEAPRSTGGGRRRTTI